MTKPNPDISAQELFRRLCEVKEQGGDVHRESMRLTGTTYEQQASERPNYNQQLDDFNNR